MGLKIEDLEKLVLVSDPKISPASRKVAFVVTRISTKEDKYNSSIWLYNITEDSYYQLTEGPSDTSPTWSPSGRYLAFVRRTEEQGKPTFELRVIDIKSCGQSRVVVKTEGGISSISWSPDEKEILFISSKGEVEKDVKHIENIPIWFNGIGFIYNRLSRLFVVDFLSGNLREVEVDAKEDISYARWSPAGKKIAYISSTDRSRPYISDIHIFDPDSGREEKLTRGNMSIEDFAWSPTGTKIVFRGSDLSRGLAGHMRLWILDLRTAEMEELGIPDRDVANAMNSDVRGPSSGQKIQWYGENIYFPLMMGYKVALYKWNEKNGISPVIEGDFTVEDYSMMGDLIASTIMSSTTPPELYLLKGGDLRKVTSFNDSLLRTAKLMKPERFSVKASDGEIIDAFILKPARFEYGKKYPAILYIHGGPATAYGESFIHEFHVLSDAGFVVIYSNPRGSTGYSEEFRDIRGKYGTRDYLDLMEVLDTALEKYGFIDPEKIGVAGGSYGGFMTNWIITHTDRFKAAVTQRSISNWLSFYGTTDIGFYFAEDQIIGRLGQRLWEEKSFEKLWDSSPLKYIGNAKTPTLILHSDEDYRCWLDQAIQLFTALKLKGVPTKLVIFPGENHDLSRNGKPKHRMERLREIVEWFNKYLKTP
ncbi:MAG: S9 family peptidase [Fervidicoccaceae archaeon]|nr:MAG: S9 family peptidase [Fervidicoccus sp.]